MKTKFSCSVCRLNFSASTDAQRVPCPRCDALITNQPFRRLIGLLGSWASLVSSPPPSDADNFGDGVPVKKRAVLCGVSYKKCKYELKGTINDVQNMKDLLIQMYGFQEPNILLLTEEQSDTRLIPTKANIENWLKWLVKNCRSGDSLVFYYSGHGLWPPDFKDGEMDGFDEAICPVDCLKEGIIIDYDIYATIVKPLPKGVTLHAIVDASYSGTILDLENVYDRYNRRWCDNRPPSGVRKQTSGGMAYCISACDVDQVSYYTSALNSKLLSGAMTLFLIEIVREKPDITYGGLLDEMEYRIDQANQRGWLGGSRIFRRLFGPNLKQALNSKTMNGAMTFVLIDAVRKRGQENITYGELLDEMRERIEQANQQGCLGSSRILTRLFGPNLTQKPMLSASEEFQVYKREFKL